MSYAVQDRGLGNPTGAPCDLPGPMAGGKRVEVTVGSDDTGWRCWEALSALRDAAGHPQTEEAEVLPQIARSACSSLSIDSVLSTIATAVVRATGACFSNTFLFPERSTYGNYYFTEPLPPAEFTVVDPPDKFMLEALRTGRVVTADDVMSDPRLDHESMKYFGAKSAMAFPVVFEGKAVAAGFAWWGRPHHITEEEVELVKAIADASAVAVENARRHQAVVQSAVIRERNRIANEMHDTLAQALAAIKLNLSCVLVSGALDAASAERVTEAKELANQTYLDLRDTIFSLRSVGCLHSEFLTSFRDYLDQYGARNGIAVSSALSEEGLSLLGVETKIQVSRILGEALSNIRKHAKAEHVWVTSHHDSQWVNILVEDDGVGIDEDRPHTGVEGCFGLAVMAERATALGGSVEIARRAPSGTYVHLKVPYR